MLAGKSPDPDQNSGQGLDQSKTCEKAKEKRGTRADLGQKLPQNSAEPAHERETRTQLAKIAGVSHDTIATWQNLQQGEEGGTSTRETGSK